MPAQCMYKVQGCTEPVGASSQGVPCGKLLDLNPGGVHVCCQNCAVEYYFCCTSCPRQSGKWWRSNAGFWSCSTCAEAYEAKPSVQLRVSLMDTQLQDEHTLCHYNSQKILTDESNAFDIETSSTIHNVKKKIEHKENIPSAQQQVFFAGAQLEDAVSFPQPVTERQTQCIYKVQGCTKPVENSQQDVPCGKLLDRGLRGVHVCCRYCAVEYYFCCTSCPRKSGGWWRSNGGFWTCSKCAEAAEAGPSVQQHVIFAGKEREDGRPLSNYYFQKILTDKTSTLDVQASNSSKT